MNLKNKTNTLKLAALTLFISATGLFYACQQASPPRAETKETEKAANQTTGAPPTSDSKMNSGDALVKFDADGNLLRPDPAVFREWIFVGAPVTPNDLNNGEAAFPEFHNVYIDPASWAEYKKTGKFREGTVMIKELTSVGSKKETSGNGYFEGEFTGEEVSIKDSKRFGPESKGWGYFSFGHKYPLKDKVKAMPQETCAACHVANAKNEMVFTQNYPVLRAAFKQ